ncbi:MAG: alpha/beta hydrolase [Prochlorococcus sp.]|nr:alpha/beta hydrolase [Prochlorococcaceae cyanobacterium Fu_MAG_50]
MNLRSGQRRRQLLAWTSTIGIGLSALLPTAHAAKDVAFVSGAYRRSISVSDIAYLAETGQPRGLLIDVLRFGKQNPKDVAKLLNQKLDLPLVLTSRLMNTRIGEVIILRIAKIIYPLKVSDPRVSVPALRAGVINGLQLGDGGLNAVQFLEAYPAEVMEVSLPALFNVIEKAESIAGLVQFFSDSPLDGLKDAKP